MRHHRPSPASVLSIAVVVTALAACGETRDATGTPIDPGPTSTSPTTEPAPGTTPPDATPVPATDVPPPGDLRYDPDIVRSELEAARARWAAQGWTSYRFDYQYVCFCDPDEARASVQIIDGRVANDTGRGIDHSIEQWFDIIDDHIGQSADVRVTFDDWGHPTSVYVDVDEMMADEEFGLEFIGFQHAPDPIASFLTDEYGCGFGFAVANPEQAASFVASFRAPATEGAETPSGTYAIGDGVGASVTFGNALMANWCDDVIEPDEPVAEVTETWRVVEGTVELSFEGDAVGVFTGLVAESPDGDRVELGDVTITNQWWGTFAG